MIDEYFVFLAEIRTICNILTVIIALLTLVGSYLYWTSWEKRSRRLREELIREIEMEKTNE